MVPAFSQTDLQRIPSETFVERVWYRRELESTSDLALKLAGQTRETPLLVLAERQTAGRGRGANRWWSGEGGLTFSLVVNWPAAGGPAAGTSPARPSTGTAWTRVSLAAGLGVREAICRHLPDKPIGLKWPNDVFLEDRKVCGILVELRPDAPDQLVVGIGLNVNNSFRDAPDTVKSLGISLRDAAGRPFAPIDILIDLLVGLDHQFTALRDDRLELAAAWRPHCRLTGQWMTIETGARKWFGRCRGVEEDGALLLDTESGPRRCYSGVVRLAER